MRQVLFIINMISSGAIAALGLFILFFIVQESEEFEAMLPDEQFVVRVGYAAVISGATCNLLAQVESGWTNVVLNIGIALLFVARVELYRRRLRKKKNGL